MWFIPMIIGLYICLPFIKPIAKNDSICRYYLIMTFCFAFVIPQIVTLTHDFGSDLMIDRVTAVQAGVNNMNMHIVMGYAGYFILGYYLCKVNFSKWQRGIVYLLGVAGFALTIFLDLIVALKTQKCCSNYYGNFNVNILLESVAVFTWFRYKKFDREKWNAFVQKLAKYSFGAYLVHAFVISELDNQFKINTLSFNPAFSVICIGVMVFAISFSVSAVLNQIPIVRKYMV